MDPTDPNLYKAANRYLSNRDTRIPLKRDSLASQRRPSASSSAFVEDSGLRRPPSRLGTSNKRRPSIEASQGLGFGYRSYSITGLEAGDEVWNLLQKSKSNMAVRTIVVITGANTGIGYETVKALLQSETQYHVFLGGRDFIKADNAAKALKGEVSQTSSDVEPLQIDVDSDASIETALKFVSAKVERVDVLINNAGASFDAQIYKGQLTTREAWNKTWNTNVTGANVVTETFLPLLLKSKSPRLLFVTSGASSLTDAADPQSPMHKDSPPGLPKPPGTMAYRSSKTGLNMMMSQWYGLLKGDGVKVWSIAPGLLITGLGGNPEDIKKRGGGDASLGGKAIVGVVEGKRDADVGRVVREYGESKVLPW